MYNTLQLRPHSAYRSHIHQQISNGRCWHFDAWLYERGGDILLRIEERAGGRKLVKPADLFLVDTSGERVALYPFNGSLDGWQQTHIDSRRVAALGVRHHLNDLHWLYVYHWAQRAPAQFSYRSVCLHYIRVPQIPAITDSTVNSWQHGRGYRPSDKLA